jgi:hypothetical protein
MKSKKHRNKCQQPPTEATKKGSLCCSDDLCKLINSPMYKNIAADDHKRLLDHDHPYTTQCQSCSGYFHNFSCGKEKCCNKCNLKGSSNVEVVEKDDNEGETSKYSNIMVEIVLHIYVED